jgi:hypothetical protein
MNDVENELRRALRPVNPPDGFLERVMRALPERAPVATVTPIALARPARAVNAWRRFSAPAALAASLLVAVIVGQHVATVREQQQQRAGLAASRELMQALRVTSQKLDIAYQAVKSPPQAVEDEEENRS